MHSKASTRHQIDTRLATILLPGHRRLILYMLSKLCIYLFLVERAYIVRGSNKPRMKNPLYLVNTFGMLLPFIAIFILNIYYKSSYIDKDGVCMIGIDKLALIPLISFDVTVNAYLTALFLIPIHRRYSSSEDKPTMLKKVGLRTFIGSLLTLVATTGNLLVRVMLNGEPGWVCFMSCNLDGQYDKATHAHCAGV
ncbi:hypothetical protein UCDDS831_g02038 [Diplodia seriata]|uniref:Integral membrane protein n=1 Tax=Diplodia seriata TaxID=420778 RepID=A0A0G2ES35_9PEZI|nr:hypothetical protein UCDDS831_g02038 [Diplodia seriata]